VVCKRVKTQYPISDKKPIILFIGSSQTWGAGASSPDKAYPYLVEKKLRSYFHDSTITVINAGICGTTSDILYGYYTKEWYQHHPLLTVIDLSHNDHDSIIFRKNIRKFLEFDQSKNIKTLLIAEPNNYTRDPLEANHRAMKQEGTQYNVETVPIQAYMDRCFDSGFIWWDWVHMTDYGYCVFSEGITPYIVKELEKDSLLLKYNEAISLHSYKAGPSHSP
jgi:lysophospholipase L1-like esterase